MSFNGSHQPGSHQPADIFGGVAEDPELLNLLQLKSVTRFTGLVVLHAEAETGVVFFRDGQIVHAEAGSETGEQAFHSMMRWSGSKFTIYPEETSSRFTIKRSLNSLLAESRRLLDAEQRETPYPPPSPTQEGAPGPKARPDRFSPIVDQIRQIPGVASVVLHGRDGVRCAATNPGARSPLEQETMCLAKLGKRVGEIFRAGPVVAGVIHGSEQQLLLLATKEFQLTILIRAAGQAEDVQAKIRKLLTSRAGA